MQNTNENIDLDALFDMLHIDAGQSDKAPGISSNTITSQSDVTTADVSELSSLDADLFLFDPPVDQS